MGDGETLGSGRLEWTLIVEDVPDAQSILVAAAHERDDYGDPIACFGPDERDAAASAPGLRCRRQAILRRCAAGRRAPRAVHARQRSQALERMPRCAASSASRVREQSAKEQLTVDTM